MIPAAMVLIVVFILCVWVWDLLKNSDENRALTYYDGLVILRDAMAYLNEKDRLFTYERPCPEDVLSQAVDDVHDAIKGAQ